MQSRAVKSVAQGIAPGAPGNTGNYSPPTPISSLKHQKFPSPMFFFPCLQRNNLLQVHRRAEFSSSSFPIKPRPNRFTFSWGGENANSPQKAIHQLHCNIVQELFWWNKCVSCLGGSIIEENLCCLLLLSVDPQRLKHSQFEERKINHSAKLSNKLHDWAISDK